MDARRPRDALVHYELQSETFMTGPWDRDHEFYFIQHKDGKWHWTWLLPLQKAALTVQSLTGLKTKAGARRNAYAQTNKLRLLMVDLSRGDMV